MQDNIKTETKSSAVPSVVPKLPKKGGSVGPRTNKQGSKSPLLMSLGLVVLCVVAGFFGAWLQSSVLGGATRLVEERKSLLVKEDSAVISVAKEVSPSVVSITTNSSSVDFFGQSQTEASSGTGIILKSDGLILTNKHVVEGGESFTVITSDGKEYSDAKVVAKDPSNDIAFLKIAAKDLVAAKLGDSSKVQVGQRVIAIGNALGQFQNTVTTGVISGKSRPITATGGNGTESLQNLFQTDAAINPGNSGGPLVNIAGEVIGINTAVAGDGAENIGFAIPINEAKKDIATVAQSGKITRAYLGVRYVAVTQDIAARNNILAKAIGGALISGEGSVLSGSPADKAGVQAGDVIIRLNDTDLNENNSLASTIGKFEVGETIKVTLLRDGKERVLKVKLAEAPAQ
jgi:serine protease Do